MAIFNSYVKLPEGILWTVVLIAHMWLGEFCCPCRYNLTQVEKKQERIVQVTSLMVVNDSWLTMIPSQTWFKGKVFGPPSGAPRCCLDVAGKLLSSCWTLFRWCFWNRTPPATQLLVRNCKKLQETSRFFEAVNGGEWWLVSWLSWYILVHLGTSWYVGYLDVLGYCTWAPYAPWRPFSPPCARPNGN